MPETFIDFLNAAARGSATDPEDMVMLLREAVRLLHERERRLDALAFSMHSMLGRLVEIVKDSASGQARAELLVMNECLTAEFRHAWPPPGSLAWRETEGFGAALQLRALLDPPKKLEEPADAPVRRDT